MAGGSRNKAAAVEDAAPGAASIEGDSAQPSKAAMTLNAEQIVRIEMVKLMQRHDKDVARISREADQLARYVLTGVFVSD